MDSNFSSWIGGSYVKCKEFQSIVAAHVKNHSEVHRGCAVMMNCSANYNLTWFGHGNVMCMLDFIRNIFPPGQIDPMAARIWAKKPTKFLAIL